MRLRIGIVSRGPQNQILVESQFLITCNCKYVVIVIVIIIINNNNKFLGRTFAQVRSSTYLSNITSKFRTVATFVNLSCI